MVMSKEVIEQIFDSLGEAQIQALVAAKVYKVYMEIFSEFMAIIMVFAFGYGCYRFIDFLTKEH